MNWFVIGPTAAGKSGLALELARLSGGVVVNMDAFQVYRGMDIGTGKPTARERAEIPHLLYDLAEPAGVFSVAHYLEAAAGVVGDARPKVWVGGTGLYFRMLRSGLAPAPPSDPAVVAELEAMPAAARVEEVRRVDPEWAARADLANPRRVIRALAVFRQSGRPLSEWHRQPVRPLVAQGRVLLLRVSAEVLRRRIAARIEAMWRAGWPEEVRTLAAVPGWESSPAFRAIGYAQVLDWVRSGGDEAACRQAIARATWQYARRQLTWFRREVINEVITADECFDMTGAARELLRCSRETISQSHD